MHIIFGTEQAQIISEKHTVLELDTFSFKPINTVSTAYCILETLPTTELDKMPKMILLHSTMLVNYRARRWDDALSVIDDLTGYWGKDMDGFYSALKTRITNLVGQELPDNWNGNVEKNVNILN
jgi:hypothetical protein